MLSSSAEPSVSLSSPSRFPALIPRRSKVPKKDLPLEPSRTIRLDTDEGSWISLDVSPDGATLVFDMLGDLYTLPFAGGTATALTSGMPFDGQPRFSPDGKSIVFTSDKDGGENLWIMELATKEARALTKGKDNKYQSPEWTPTGSTSSPPGPGSGGVVQLWMFHGTAAAGSSW